MLPQGLWKISSLVVGSFTLIEQQCKHAKEQYFIEMRTILKCIMDDHNENPSI